MVMLIIGCFTATEEGDFTMKILGFVHAGVVVEDINKAIKKGWEMHSPIIKKEQQNGKEISEKTMDVEF